MKSIIDKDGSVLYITSDSCVSYRESTNDVETIWYIDSDNNICGATIIGINILKTDSVKRKWFWDNSDWKNVPKEIIDEVKKYVRS
jgi:hypothetical protein